MNDYASVINTLRSHGFKAMYFEQADEAKAYLAANIKDEVVGFGGSQTVQELGLYDLLAAENKVYWHWKEMSEKEQFAEFTTYVTSVNGLAESGELVNIDGVGNRVSATLYGPQKVYFVVGINKLAPDLAAAIERARNIAAPANAKSKGKSTPCVKLGKCADCNHPERICSAMAVHMRPMMGKEHEVILIGEDLGF